MPPEYFKYFVFGLSFAITTYIFTMGDHLWKKRFFRTCLLIAGLQFLAGTAVEILRVFDTMPGIVFVTMSSSIVFLGHFSFFRILYKRIYDTEPHITSITSTIGSRPLDMFSSAARDGKERKYAKARQVTMADFVFTALSTLAPAFTILAMLALVKRING
jgi:hypothetical protein